MSIYRLNKSNIKHSNGTGYITRSGHTMFNEDIVSDLKRMEFLEEENEKLKEEKAQLVEWFSAGKLHLINEYLVIEELKEIL